MHRSVIKILLTLLVLATGAGIAGCNRSEEAVQRSGKPDYLWVPEVDTDMDKAVAEARRTFPQFLSALQSPAANQGAFAVKVAFVEGKAVEHIWLGDVRYDGKLIHGLVGNDPVNMKDVKLNDQASVAPSAISDWMFVQDGMLMGGHTIRLLYSRASPQEQHRLEAQAPFRME
jgi:uncharacterized protein YegJ (DUF2314 family)